MPGSGMASMGIIGYCIMHYPTGNICANAAVYIYIVPTQQPLWVILFSLKKRVKGKESQVDEMKIRNEPVHDKTYNKTCATSEDSYQSAHPRNLTRVYADRMCLLQTPGYSKRNKRGPLDAQADPSLCWSHRSYCKFCRALAH